TLVRRSSGSRRIWLAILAGVSVLAVACSGGGGDTAGDDPTDIGAGSGERNVSFKGAGGLKLAGTLAVPEKPVGGGVVILSDYGNIDRNGVLDSAPVDPLYADMSKSLVAAGVPTLRYDRRAIGESKLDSGARLTYDNLVDDGKAAVDFLGQRADVGKGGVVVVGHNAGGLMALRVAADPKVKAVVLVSTPGRPVVDVMAELFTQVYGAQSAAQFRTIVADFLASGSLPGPEAIPPQFQTVLGQGQGDVLKGLFTVDPVTDAQQVKVPTMVLVGAQSITVTKLDADRLSQAIGSGATVAVTKTGPTLREVPPDAGPVAFVAGNDSTHLFGARNVTDIPRDQDAVNQVVSFVTSKLSVR
ncbi:MAG: alpha/beta fold hydrolase, partial [Acidimicrobiales bacterium]